MVYIDVTKEELPEIEIKGKYALFTDLRVEQGTVPDGMYCYALRHGDDDVFPCTVEEQVKVNYFGAVLLAEPLDFGGKDSIPVGYEDFGFTGERLNTRQFMEKMERFRTEGVFEYNGFHYLPVRTFNQEEKDMSLKEISRFLRDVKGTALGMVPYDYDRFYGGFREKYGKDTPADIFLCLETGKEYIPCEYKLMEYTKDREVKKEKAR